MIADLYLTIKQGKRRVNPPGFEGMPNDTETNGKDHLPAVADCYSKHLEVIKSILGVTEQT
jgi:hypothetical protein